MTQSYFVSLECTDPDITEALIPMASKYGIKSVMGISDPILCDITTINSSAKLEEKLYGSNVDSRFNQKFFPHLPDEFCFGENIDEPSTPAIKNEHAEHNFILKKAIVRNEDSELICQISACLRPNENPLVEMFQENDKHFTRESVSSSFILN